MKIKKTHINPKEKRRKRDMKNKEKVTTLHI